VIESLDAFTNNHAYQSPSFSSSSEGIAIEKLIFGMRSGEEEVLEDAQNSSELRTLDPIYVQLARTLTILEEFKSQLNEDEYDQDLNDSDPENDEKKKKNYDQNDSDSEEEDLC